MKNILMQLKLLRILILRRSAVIFSILLIILSVMPITAKAATMEDCLKVMNKDDCESLFLNSVWFKPDESLNCNGVIGEDPKPNPNIFVLGDSYLEGINDTLVDSLKEKGYTDIAIDASQGRSITAAGTTKSMENGLDAIDTNDDIIRNSNTIIIELGTNSENDFKLHQEEFLNKIRTLNSSANYYWVNVAKKVATELDNTANQVIEENAATFDYKVIDWKKVVAESKKDYFADDSVHPWSNGGKEAYTKTITEAIGTPPTATTNSQNLAVSGFYTTDKSKENGARIWEFLTNGAGLSLSTNQAAGVMGNLKQESGYDPNLNQSGGKGYGLVQWTRGGNRFNDLQKFKEKNKDKLQDEMDIQLNFIKQELSQTYFKETLALLRSSNEHTFKDSLRISDAVVAATLIFHGTSDNFTVPGITYGHGYEASGDSLDYVINNRGKIKGYEALEQYGGGAVATITASQTAECVSSTSGGPGANGWELKDMTLYNQGGKDKWTEKGYSGCGTLGDCGCPVITAATIISTLTTTKIDPGKLLDDNPSGGWISSVVPRYGLTKEDLSVDASGFSKLAEILKKGGLGAIHVNTSPRSNEFSSGGEHYFVIRKFENDKFYVYTLFNGEKNEKAYSVEDFLSNGTVELWGITNPNGPPRSSGSNVSDWGSEIEKIISNATISATYAPKWNDTSIAGNGTWTPKYVMLHHTAGTNSAEIIEKGHDGYLGIPRAHFLVNKDGSIKVFSKFMTYHAGKGNGINEVPEDAMNDYSFGIEVESLGTQKDFTDAQTKTVVKLTAGLLKAMGVSENNVLNHKTWSNTGKNDTLYSDAYWRDLIKKEM